MGQGCARCVRLLRVIARRHVEHYRSCGCLGDASECCVTGCPCHALVSVEAAQPALPLDPFEAPYWPGRPPPWRQQQ